MSFLVPKECRGDLACFFTGAVESFFTKEAGRERRLPGNG